MISLDSLLGLFNTFSLTNHHNFALLVILLIIVFHNKIILPASRLSAGFLGAGRLALAKARTLPLGEITVGLLVIASILIVFTPVSVPVMKGVWTPLSLSAPGQPNDLVSGPPRTTDEVRGTRQSEIFASPDGFLRKPAVFLLWTLIFSYLILSFRPVIARFNRPEKTLKSWFRYLCQLLDLPPPASVLVSA